MAPLTYAALPRALHPTAWDSEVVKKRAITVYVEEAGHGNPRQERTLFAVACPPC